LLTDESRLENAAGYIWHVALAAVELFAGAPATGMDLSRIVNPIVAKVGGLFDLFAIFFMQL
jgi:hypothetical protein